MYIEIVGLIVVVVGGVVGWVAAVIGWWTVRDLERRLDRTNLSREALRRQLEELKRI